MRIKKVAAVIAIAFLIRVLIACCKCPPVQQCHYQFNNLNAVNLDNSGASPVVAATDTVPKAAFGIRLDLGLIPTSTCKTNSYSLFSEARAQDCVCAPPIHYVATDTISSIVITTVNDFDSQHPANSLVTGLFKVSKYPAYITIDEFLKSPETTYYDSPTDEIVDLFLLTPPPASGNQRFKVDITFSNQQVKSVTQIINLK